MGKRNDRLNVIREDKSDCEFEGSRKRQAMARGSVAFLAGLIFFYHFGSTKAFVTMAIISVWSAFWVTVELLTEISIQLNKINVNGWYSLVASSEDSSFDSAD